MRKHDGCAGVHRLLLFVQRLAAHSSAVVVVSRDVSRVADFSCESDFVCLLASEVVSFPH